MSTGGGKPESRGGADLCIWNSTRKGITRGSWRVLKLKLQQIKIKAKYDFEKGASTVAVQL